MLAWAGIRVGVWGAALAVALAQVLAEKVLGLALVPALALWLPRQALVTLVDPSLVLLTLEVAAVLSGVIVYVALSLAGVALRILVAAGVGALVVSADVWLGGGRHEVVVVQV